uniref:Uncharacterized protein n=1 Tax=Arundo donax TaxID=35708 RepID=A0A0A9DTG4_ARUDO
MLDCILKPSMERASIFSIANGARSSSETYSEAFSPLNDDDKSAHLPFFFLPRAALPPPPTKASMPRLSNRSYLSADSRADPASKAICCIILPLTSSKGISLLACIDNFSIPTEAKPCNISIIPEPISAGSTIGEEVCMTKLQLFFASLNRAGFIDRRNPPSCV